MDIIGKWKLAAMLGRDENFDPVWKSVEQLREEGDPDLARMLGMVEIFNADGSVIGAAPIPEGATQEEIDAAVAAGKLELCGENMMVLEKKRWKEEGGAFKFDTGMTGETFGEPVDPWVEIKFEGELMELPMFRFKKL